jgi:UDP-glucose 4-epimerase
MGSVAVVGAGGYVGGRLVAHLRGAGVEVVPVSRRLRPWLGDGNVAVDLLGDPPATLDRALDGAQVVVHVAGHDEVVAAREPERALLETVTMTQRVADAVRRSGIGRVVYLSTVHVYGAGMQPGAVLTEEVLPQPRSPYALARLTSEHLLAGVLAGSAEVVSLRLTNSVGAPASVEVDRWTLLVNDLCRQAARSDQVVLQTAGLQHRDWVALGDVCRAVAAACDPAAVPAGTYNLGSGTTASVREMADLVAGTWADVTGRRPGVVAPATSEAAPPTYQVDVSRLAALGIRLDTPIAAAVEEVVRFCASHRDELRAEPCTT